MISGKLFYEGALTWASIQTLADRVREGDAIECAATGLSPLQALTTGLMFGNAIGVYRHSDNVLMGAYGWTPQGTIWSLFARLTRAESREVLTHTREVVYRMVCQSKRGYLSNWVACRNKAAIKWLRKSRAFGIDPAVKSLGGEPHHYFETFHRSIFEKDAYSPVLEASAHV